MNFERVARLLGFFALVLCSFGFAAGPKLKPGVIVLGAKANEPLRLDLAEYLQEPFETPRWSLSGAPAWMGIGPDGILFGTPQCSDVGTREFRISVLGAESAELNHPARVVVENSDDCPY